MLTRQQMAVIYCRVSTEKQKQKNLSLPGQVTRCKEKAKILGLEILHIFVEAESASDNALKRPEFQRAINLALQDSRVSSFIVYDTSRFARDRIDAAVYKGLLRKNDIDIIYVVNDIGNSMDDKLFEGIMEVIDDYNAKKIGQLALRGLEDNAKKGFWNGSTPPLGYRVVKTIVDGHERSKLEPDPLYSTLIKQIFDWVLNDDMGAIQISRRLNERNIKTRKGNPWNSTCIYTILHNKCYTGTIKFKDIITPNAHEAIISEKDFERVQMLLHARAPIENNNGRINPNRIVFFTGGILRCGICGSGMRSMPGRSHTGKTHYYYECRNARRGGKCKSCRYRALELDETLLTIIKQFLFKSENMNSLLKEVVSIAKKYNASINNRRKRVKGKIANINLRIHRLMEIIEENKGLANDILQRITELKHSRNQLEKESEQIKEVSIPDFSNDLVERVKEYFGNIVLETERDELISYFQKIGMRIIIGPENTVTFTVNPALIIGEFPYSGFIDREIWLLGQDSNLQPSD